MKFMFGIKFDILVLLFLGFPILASYVCSIRPEWLSVGAVIWSTIFIMIFLLMMLAGTLIQYEKLEKKEKNRKELEENKGEDE